MVLPPCPMADFVVPRHSAVMERLRRRIELCRRHHSACESRYQAVSPERLELERQQTFALHQRCLQAKAKRAGKHRQPQPPAAPPPAAPSQPPPSGPAPASAASAAASTAADRPGANGLDADTAGGEQQQQQQQPGRSSALIAVRSQLMRPRRPRGPRASLGFVARHARAEALAFASLRLSKSCGLKRGTFCLLGSNFRQLFLIDRIPNIGSRRKEWGFSPPPPPVEKNVVLCLFYNFL